MLVMCTGYDGTEHDMVQTRNIPDGRNIHLQCGNPGIDSDCATSAHQLHSEATKSHPKRAARIIEFYLRFLQPSLRFNCESQSVEKT